MTARSIDDYHTEVIYGSSGDSLHVVNLDEKTCTCRRFESEKLPCVHAIAAAEYRDKCRISLCSPYYHNSYLVNAYAESIMPVDSALQVPDNVANQACFPPVVRQQPGRPKKGTKMSSASESTITYDPEARFLHAPRSWREGSLWTVEDKHFKTIFERAEFIPAKFACRKTLHKMGIARGVDDLLEAMNFGQLAHMEYDCYPELCKDFLSTVTLVEIYGVLFIEFLLEETKYQLPMSAFCRVYGFPEGRFEPEPRFNQASNVWRNIALPADFVAGESRLSMVKNPVVRYVLHLLATTFFGRHDCSHPNKTELSLLYHGISGAMRVAPEHRVNELVPPPNPGSIFLRCLLKHKFDWDQPDAEPAVYIGALLTPLFEEVGFNLAHYTGYKEEPCKLDELDLSSRGYLLGEFTYPRALLHQFINNDNNMSVLPLPHPIARTTTAYENLQLETDGSNFFIPPLRYNIVPPYY